MPLNLENVFKCMESHSGPKAVIDAVYSALDRRRRLDDPDKPREQYLDENGLRNRLITAVNCTEKVIYSHAGLDQFIRTARIPVERLFNGDTRLAPWD